VGLPRKSSAGILDAEAGGLMDAAVLKFLGQCGFGQQTLDLASLVLAHKGAAALALFLGSGVGVSILIRVLNALPLGWWYSSLRVTAGLVSAAGRRRLTAAVWRPLELWFENFLGKSVDAIREGLEADDAPPTAEKPATAQPDPLPPPFPVSLATQETAAPRSNGRNADPVSK
jgi:hypothetical protein